LTDSVEFWYSGWEPNSYAYHGYDGRRYVDSERGEQYAPRFGTGDVIGCGLLAERREIFFTKNGAHLGIAFVDITTVVYPTVGLHSPGEKVSFNFGSAPFLFDVQRFAASQRSARHSHIELTPTPPVSIDGLVRAYLLHFNYAETLAKFDSSDSAAGNGGEVLILDELEPIVPRGNILPKAQTALGANCAATRCTTLLEHMLSTMMHRRQLRLHVLRGDVQAAFDLSNRLFPALLARHPYVQFRLQCQYFIEMLRRGEAMAAVAYAQSELTVYQPPLGRAPTRAAASELDNVIALIAYDDPCTAEEPQASLMSRAYRESTADCLNEAVLEEHGIPPQCTIERLFRHLMIVTEVNREANLGYGDSLCVDDRLSE